MVLGFTVAAAGLSLELDAKQGKKSWSQGRAQWFITLDYSLLAREVVFP